MQTPQFYVGIDVASETLAVALTRGPGQPLAKPLAVASDPDGFTALAAWLAEHGAAPEDALVCLESTGVYGEALCYWLHEHGFRLAVEDAAKVGRAMPVTGAKTDALDAQRIAPPTVGGWATPRASSTSCDCGHLPRPSWSRSRRC